jgi:hypothetical protein
MSEHRICAQLVNDVVNAVVGYTAAGEDRVANYRRNSRRRRAAEYLAARGHVEILAGDLIRPVGVRGDELVWW